MSIRAIGLRSLVGVTLVAALSMTAHAAPKAASTEPSSSSTPSDPIAKYFSELEAMKLIDAESGTLESLRKESPQRLASARPSFSDQRLQELLFRYRARNFPATLNEAEAERWEEHRAARLFEGAGGARTVDLLFSEIDQLSESADERGEEILGALYDYAEMVAPQRQ